MFWKTWFSSVPMLTDACLPMGCSQSLKAIIGGNCGNEVGEEGMDVKDNLEENNCES